MRRLLLIPLFALSLSACGGTSPELYNIVIDYFALPNSCYQNNAQPSTNTTAAPPTLLQVSVWDGAANEAFLDIVSGGASVDMGDAPNVTIGGVLRGSKSTSSTDWVFVSDSVTARTLLNSTNTVKQRFSVSFTRGGTFKGTAGVSSSVECAGSTCSNFQPKCEVANVPMNGARLAVNYQTNP
jgi:hypothetical protein